MSDEGDVDAAAEDVVPTTLDSSRGAPVVFEWSPLLLAHAFRSPISGAVFAGDVGDTGLDLASQPIPQHAIADATGEYVEKGHTRWVGPHDTP